MSGSVNHVLRGAVDVVVIGAGHSGLAMSHYLSARSIDHVVLERGEVANSWRRERWDSLKLLTPNWMSSLPGYAYRGSAPDDYMDMEQIASFIGCYAKNIRAPIYSGTKVTSVFPVERGYRVSTNQGVWSTRAVVIASGACNRSSIPRISATLPTGVQQLSSLAYRNPGQLDEGGVLVVGASATGIQLAEEIHLSGRPVTLAVGEHVRLPRIYRNRDIQWWMHTIGTMDERLEMVDDVNRVRNVPSPQLIGSRERRTLDLNTLAELGVEMTGRLAGVRDNRAQFSGSLRNVCALADLKMGRLLDSVDTWVDAYGYTSEKGDVERPEPTRVGESPILELDLVKKGIRTVIWATGYRPDYSWLDVPVLDHKGRIRHEGGIVDAPGMYVLGLPFLRRRKSSFIHGADDDARELCAHLAAYLDSTADGRALRLVV